MKTLSYNHIKVAILWLLIAVCFSLHVIYHLSALFFGVDIKIPDSKGVVPMDAHIFRILVDIFTFLFVILSLYIFNKIFYWISFGWSVLLGILNAYHLFETVTKEWQDYSQVALLTLILAANILLIRELWLLAKSPALRHEDIN